MLAPPSRPSLLVTPLTRLLTRVREWPVETQLGARRNAMIASTALTARRAEREDVEAYFATRTPGAAAGRALPRVGG